jgi:hypothetical protein
MPLGSNDSSRMRGLFGAGAGIVESGQGRIPEMGIE